MIKYIFYISHVRGRGEIALIWYFPFHIYHTPSFHSIPYRNFVFSSGEISTREIKSFGDLSSSLSLSPVREM